MILSDKSFKHGLRHLRAFVKRNGHARVAYRFKTPGLHLGQWVTKVRTAYAAGQLTPAQIAAFEALPEWSWKGMDVRRSAGLRSAQARAIIAFVQNGGDLRTVTPANEYALAKIVSDVRARHERGQLPAVTVAALDALPHWCWSPRRATASENTARIAELVRANGHLPRDHEDPVLRKWMRNQQDRYARGTLPREIADALSAIPGWKWDAPPPLPPVPLVETPIATQRGRPASLQDILTALERYAFLNGNARVPKYYRCADGYPLGTWVWFQRMQWRKGAIAPALAAQLEQLPGWSWNPAAEARQAIDTFIAPVRDFARNVGPLFTLTPDTHPDVHAALEAVRERVRTRTLPRRIIMELRQLTGWTDTEADAARMRQQKRARRARLRRTAAQDVIRPVSNGRFNPARPPVPMPERATA